MKCKAWTLAALHLQSAKLSSKIARQFPKQNILFATQIYEKVSAPSLTQLQTRLDWTELRIYDINEKGRNHGILLGTKGWAPR
jgi:exoribonuclease R